ACLCALSVRFFFSSRRRHTRFSRDWSSDVCSSDLHHGRLPLYHMDLYRLERAADVEALGLEEFLEGDGVAVVEWAAHLPEGLRPEEGLVVRLDVVDEQVRAVELVARGRRMEGLLGQLAMGEGVQQGPDDEQRKE